MMIKADKLTGQRHSILQGYRQDIGRIGQDKTQEIMIIPVN